MKNQKGLIILAVIIVIVLMSASVLYDLLGTGNTPPPQEVTPNVSDDANTSQEEDVIPAPNFTMTDTDGNQVDLESFFGKPIVLNFWASWCPPCKEEMPGFDAVYKEFGEDVHFIMLNSTDGARETIEIANDYIADSAYSFPVYFDYLLDEEGNDIFLSVGISYGVSSLPTTLFIDENGNIENAFLGSIPEADLRILVEGMLK